MAITAPLGHYDETRTVNFGANRWAVAPELGIAHRFRRFTLEGAATLAFFSDNDEYLIDQTLTQEPDRSRSSKPDLSLPPAGYLAGLQHSLPEGW